MQDLAAVSARRYDFRAILASYRNNRIEFPFSLGDSGSDCNLLRAGTVHGVYIDAGINFPAFTTDCRAYRMIFVDCVVIEPNGLLRLRDQFIIFVS